MDSRTAELFNSLLYLMKQHEELVKKLLQVGGTQQEALRTNNIELLDEAVTDINSIANQLADLEGKRQGVQREAELHLGLPQDSSMQALLQFAPDNLREELEDCRKMLRYSTDLFKELNNVNQVMIKNAIRFNKHMLKTLLPPEEVYGGDGTLHGAGRRDTLFNKTI